MTGSTCPFCQRVLDPDVGPSCPGCGESLGVDPGDGDWIPSTSTVLRRPGQPPVESGGLLEALQTFGKTGRFERPGSIPVAEAVEEDPAGAAVIEYLLASGRLTGEDHQACLEARAADVRAGRTILEVYQYAIRLGHLSATMAAELLTEGRFVDRVAAAGGGSLPLDPPTELRVGATIGPYTVVERIGRGSSGVVYRVADGRDGSDRALKILRERSDERHRRRFEREIDAIGSVDHPNVIRILDAGSHAEHPYFVMEYTVGRTLQEDLAARDRIEGRLGLRDLEPLLDVYVGALEGVAAAHAVGLVHRDIKPANVLIETGGRTRVTDFGLAKRVDSGTYLTRSGEILGTPYYMAPEQTRGKIDEIGPPADVFGLGVVLYRILTGRLPFRAERAMDLFHRICEREPTPPRRLNPAIPPDLERICLKALEKEPRHRHADAAELLLDVRRFLEGAEVRSKPTTSVYRFTRRLIRGRWVVLAVALLGAALAAAILAALAG